MKIALEPGVIAENSVKINGQWRDSMRGHMVLYRGYLKSCNYQCSYCPFSKHPMSQRELEKDRERWFSFVQKYEERAERLGIRAMMIVPYGEAMIHPWYWEGLARMSAQAWTHGVGAQTNLSFPVEKFLEAYKEMNGLVGKLRIWATFHPEMTTVSAFADRCRQLTEAGAALCAGSVGVPENINVLRQLKSRLPEEVYLWVNKMDGLKRPYTEEEKEAFWEIDPYFIRELTPVRADVSRCENRLFVESDGRIHTCNISKVLESRWEEKIPAPKCNRKICSCYLAYGGRSDYMNRILFGEYPLYRIPRRPKAVFFDIEGTLLPEESLLIRPGEERSVAAGLEALARDGTRLFFATTLPYEEAMKRCRYIRRLFQGGIFAGGAHIRLEYEQNAGEGMESCSEADIDSLKRGKEYFAWLDEQVGEYFTTLKRKYHFNILTYKQRGKTYKITLLRPKQRKWEAEEAEEMMAQAPEYGEQIRYYIEGNCLQIVAGKADKASGVKTLCRWLGISPEEVVAIGDSEEDKGMMALCGASWF